MKIGICIPSQDDCKSGFAFDLARMVGNFSADRCGVERKERDEVSIYNHRGTLIADQREALAHKALAERCDAVLYLDADMRFPKSLLHRLLKHEKPFVAANYTTRRKPIHAVASASSKGPWVPVNSTPEKSGLEAVSAVGFGATLIRADVFKALPRPWFMVGYHADTKQYYGEDVWFCRLARAHGIEITIDHDLAKEMKHVGSYEYSFADLETDNGD